MFKFSKFPFSSCKYVHFCGENFTVFMHFAAVFTPGAGRAQSRLQCFLVILGPPGGLVTRELSFHITVALSRVVSDRGPDVRTSCCGDPPEEAWRRRQPVPCPPHPRPSCARRSDLGRSPRTWCASWFRVSLSPVGRQRVRAAPPSLPLGCPPRPQACRVLPRLFWRGRWQGSHSLATFAARLCSWGGLGAA